MSRAGQLITRHDESLVASNEAALLKIEVSTEGNHTYYQTSVRQTQYTIHQNKQGDWEVWSKRKNMATMGQIRFFDSLEDLEKAVKSLRGIEAQITDLQDGLDEAADEKQSGDAIDVVESRVDVAEGALDHDADDSYEAALLLLHTMAKANGYKKGAKALADTMDIGKHEPVAIDELVDYFEGANDHNVAGVATAIKRRRPDWVLVALMELEKIQANSDGVTEAFTRLRVAVNATDAITKKMVTDIEPVALDADLAKVVNAIPAKDRKNLVANWKFEF
ncbi:MAG: hypothetical protein GY833_12415 [Aestuariibacter sp.]|nr:hypothetical protein [Aestuariibacter sp.]